MHPFLEPHADPFTIESNWNSCRSLDLNATLKDKAEVVVFDFKSIILDLLKETFFVDFDNLNVDPNHPFGNPSRKVINPSEEEKNGSFCTTMLLHW